MNPLPSAVLPGLQCRSLRMAKVSTRGGPGSRAKKVLDDRTHLEQDNVAQIPQAEGLRPRNAGAVRTAGQGGQDEEETEPGERLAVNPGPATLPRATWIS